MLSTQAVDQELYDFVSYPDVLIMPVFFFFWGGGGQVLFINYGCMHLLDNYTTMPVTFQHAPVDFIIVHWVFILE